MIETERLILRPWREADREPYADIMVDPAVGQWLGGPFTREQAHERIARFSASLAESGLGRLAIERRSDGRMIGHCGLAQTPEGPTVPQGLEIGWALAPDAWGSGFAAEAARAVIADGFARFDAPEVLAFTGTTNHRSQAVMRRLGMIRMPERDFDHPLLAEDHPLRRHVVYSAPRPYPTGQLIAAPDALESSALAAAKSARNPGSACSRATMTAPRRRPASTSDW